MNNLEQLTKYINKNTEDEIIPIRIINENICNIGVAGSFIAICFGLPVVGAIALSSSFATLKHHNFSDTRKLIQKIFKTNKYTNEELAVNIYKKCELVYKALLIVSLSETMKEFCSTEKNIYHFVFDQHMENTINDIIEKSSDTYNTSIVELIEFDFEKNGLACLFWEDMIRLYIDVIRCSKEHQIIDETDICNSLLQTTKEKMSSYIHSMTRDSEVFDKWIINHFKNDWNTDTPLNFQKTYDMYFTKITTDMKRELSGTYNSMINIENAYQNFIGNPSWGNEVLERIVKIQHYFLENKDNFQADETILMKTINKIISVKTNIYKSTYQELTYTLEKLVNLYNHEFLKNKKDRSKYATKAYNLINSIISSKRYGRILLTTGFSGSGKTHQIYRFVDCQDDYVRTSNNYFVRMSSSTYKINMSMDEFFLKEFQKILKIKSNNSDEILTNYRRHKLFFIFDNLGSFMKINENFIKELLEFLDDSTKFNNIYVYMAVPYHLLYQILGNTTEYSNYFYKEDRSDIESLTCNNWTNLSKINSTKKTGLDIITNINSSLLDNKIKPTKDVEYLNIYNPRIAWKVLESAEMFKDKSIYISNYSFASTFDDYIKLRIKADFNIDGLSIENLIFIMTNLMIEHCSTDLKRHQIDMCFLDQNSGSLCTNKSEVKKYLDILCTYGYLDITQDDVNDIYSLKDYSSWINNIINYFINYNKESELNDYLLTYQQLDNESLNICISDIALDYYSLKGKTKDGIKFIRESLKNGNMKSILYSGPHMDDKFQKEIHRQTEDEDWIYSYANYFAYVYFISYSNKRIIKNELKLNRILRKYKDACNFGLAEYLNQQISEIFASIDTIIEFENCLKPLLRISDRTITRALGTSCAKTMIRLTNKRNISESRLVSNVLDVTMKILTNPDYKGRIQDSVNKVQESVFIHELLLNTFSQLMEIEPVQLHYRIYKKKKFDSNKILEIKSLNTTIKKALTVSFGRYYNNNKSKTKIVEEMVKFVDYLISDNDFGTDVFAFHYIINTELEPNKFPIDKVFHSSLKTLYQKYPNEVFFKERLDIYKINFFE